jgi:signal transduction histidine kinase
VDRGTRCQVTFLKQGPVRTLLIGAGTGIRRRAERFIYISTAAFALTAWGIFAAFVVEARDDVLHDARVEVVDSQHILGSHIDTAYESAETLLKIADSWLEEASLRPIRPPLSALAAHLAELTESDERAIVIVTAEEDGTELPFSKVAIQQPVSTASPSDLTRDPTEDDDTIVVDAQRFDSFAQEQALPLTMRAGANAYGIKYLRALLPIRVGEGPFGLLMPGLPARIGVARPDGEIVSSWPIEGGPIGQRVDALRDAAEAPPDSAVFTTAEEFPGIGRAYVSYAKVDSAPLVVFASLSSAFVATEVWRRIEIPGLITLFGSSLIGLGGVLIARATRRSRIEVENTKQALNAAEAANEAKRQFLANMSHELRTPLNAINGFAEVMHHQLFGPLGDQRYVGYAADILGSGRHLLGLIQTILDMARFEGNNVTLSDEPTSIRAVVRDTIRLLHERATAKQVSLHVEVADDVLVRMDPVHLRQIVINLVSNAIKFSKAQGVIAIDSQMAPDGGVTLRVTDTGIGIPSESIDKLFVPFSQVDSAYSRKHDGVGLGLSICRSIMNAYGGKISLQSAVGMGTMVTLQLPAERVVTAAEAAALARAAA